MKNIPHFLLAILWLCVSCTSIEQYRESIETTTQQWSDGQQQLKSFQTRLDQAHADWKSAFAQAQRSPLDLQDLPEPTLNKLDSLGKACRAFGASFTSLEERLQVHLVSEWLENQKYLDQLNEGLETGKLMGDAASQLAIINQVILATNDSLASWNHSLQELAAKSQTTCASFGDVIQ